MGSHRSSTREGTCSDIDSLFGPICLHCKKNPHRSRAAAAAADSETSAQHFQRLKDRSVAILVGDLGAQHYLTRAISFIHRVCFAPSAPHSAICCIELY